MKNRYLVFINGYCNSAETEDAFNAFHTAFKTIEDARQYCNDHYKKIKNHLESYDYNILDVKTLVWYERSPIDFFH